jgi:hypothetical protein
VNHYTSVTAQAVRFSDFILKGGMHDFVEPSKIRVIRARRQLEDSSADCADQNNRWEPPAFQQAPVGGTARAIRLQWCSQTWPH